MNRLICSTLMAVCCLLICAVSQAQIYDSTDDFGVDSPNPNGVWSYGYTASLGSTFTPFSEYVVSEYGVGWNTDLSGGAPAFWKNLGNSTHFGVAPGQASLHGGPNGEFAVLRFTAPSSGDYHITGEYFTGDIGETDANLLLNSNAANPLFSTGSTTGGGTFFRSLHLNQNDTLDLVIGTVDGFSSDNTPVDLHISTGWRLAWQNTQNGDVAFWLMNGTSATRTGYVARAVPSVWNLVGALDLNADGSNDFLWRNTSTGDLVFWLMNGTTQSSYGTLQRSIPLAWRPVAVADLNNDGKKDLIWQNTQNGDVVYWLLNGTAVSSTGYLARAVPTVWQITAALDLNADNKPDLLWRNTSTGDVIYWLMNGTTQSSYGTLQKSVPLAWRLATVADIDGDGKSELIWQNSTTGDVVYWLLNGTTVSSTGYLAMAVPTIWQIRTGF